MSSAQRLDLWAAKYVQTSPLSFLKDARIGVDATYYLDLRLNESKDEPLKVALGGIPFLLRSSVEDDIKDAKEAGYELFFVFNGLDFVNKPTAASGSAAGNKPHEDGWSRYYRGDAAGSVKDFGRARYPTDTMLTHLRQILWENGIEYIVAPYSATAQLSHMLNTPEPWMDAVVSSTEAFLFNTEKVILNLNSVDKSFTWLEYATCVEQLGRVPTEVFRDAQLLLGSSFLLTFPPLERIPPQKLSITDALNLLNGAGRSVLTLCQQYRDDPAVQAIDYADRYKKAVMAIRHHVVLKSKGVVEPLEFDRAPSDVHEFVGQRLPDELFFYISRGLLGSQIPNWLTSGDIVLTPPGGILDSEPYRKLIIEQLNPLRTQALKIISESLHYYYSSREINVRPWDGRDATTLKIELKEASPLKSKASEWKVKSELLGSKATVTLRECVRLLQDKSFAAKTITRAKIDHPALKSRTELLANVYWRVLQIRGYVNDKHELTLYGQTLHEMLTSIPSSQNADVAVIAVEMLRLGLLNTSSVTGASVSTQDKDFAHKTCVNLISKIACFGRLEHESVGYVGPLDRQMLCFAWMITAVRTSLRDLVEAVLISMLLNGEAERDRDDWFEIPQELPFNSDNGAALGVAAKTYLDMFKDKEPTDDLKDQIKDQEDKYAWFPKVKNLRDSLAMAFGLFEAVNVGAQTLYKDSKDVKQFSDAHVWLQPRA